MTLVGQPSSPDERPDPAAPRDNPFLERLFGAMCQSVYVLPDDTFVDQVARWMEAFRFMAALAPRNEDEWLLAADVAMRHLFARHSLVLSRSKGLRAKQRMRHGAEFIANARILHDARLRYDMVRSRPTDC